MKANVNWSEDKERYILYADLMGFKERVRTTPHVDLKHQLLSFRTDLIKAYTPLQKGGQLKIVQYSDSILIVDNYITDNGLNRISKAAARLMHTALLWGFPLKGVLAKGMLTFDEDNELYFGQPLIDAFLLHEELHFYGVVAHHSIEKDILDYSNGTTHTNRPVSNPYIHSPIPIKGGNTSHFYLAYNLIDKKLECGKDLTEECNQWLDEIEKTVSGKPRVYIDNTRRVLRKAKELYDKKADKVRVGDSPMAKSGKKRVSEIFPIRASVE